MSVIEEIVTEEIVTELTAKGSVHSKGVRELIEVLEKHEGWKEKLAASVKDACFKVKHKLTLPQQMRFQLLPDGKTLMDWPEENTSVDETLEKYYQFLDSYVTWKPTERGHDEHVDECLFQLARFYWLIDQPDGLELQQHVEAHEAKGNAFTRWMVVFAKDWGSFLSTSKSLIREDLLSFYDDPTFNVLEYVGSVEPRPGESAEHLADRRWEQAQVTWKSFNQFFSRETKPGLRPVAGMFDDRIICAPADFTFRMKARIDDDSRITVKQTHTYSVLDLLDDSLYRERFKGGLFMHSFLSTFDYHRFRAPVRGTVLECRTIQGEVYLGVDLRLDATARKQPAGQEASHPDLMLHVTDETGYQFSQTRGLIIWDSPIGLVAALPMGMAQVSGVNMTAVVGAYLNKGEEFGYFLFGGSDMILLFEAGSGVTITSAPKIHTNAGMCIGEVVPSTV